MMKILIRRLRLLPLLVLPALVSAEPMFLSKQYTRCATCHFSPTGGGLLTPYGRSLSREELSTFGSKGPEREHEFLWGALGDRLGALSLGATFRPARLDLNFTGGSLTRKFIMNADVAAAFRRNGWTLYAEVGRQGRTARAEIDSFEHWIAYEGARGLGFRAGRFLPAYGVRLSDHTTFTRRSLGFDIHDQAYAIEASRSSEKSLIQVSFGPGRAASLIDDDGRASFTASARAQFDLGRSRSLVLSALRRNAADHAAAETLGGIAFGFAPSRRWSVWTEGDVRSEEGRGSAYSFANETSFEVHRGLWLKLTPQLRTLAGDSGGGLIRAGAAVDWLPRTHLNLGLLYYRDKDRRSDASTKTLLAQLHVYF
jgi:hypothetical protein